MSKEEMLTQTALWFQQMKETNNESFLPLLFDDSRYLVLKGGGGSGKSIFAGRKVLERCVTEAGSRWLVCRKVAKTLRESCFKQLIGQLVEYYPDAAWKANRGDMLISFANGSEIIFAGLDDVEKLKSIYDLQGIWIEEASELLDSDFNQLDIRLRGESRWKKQIIITFNPVSVTHWLKRRFFDVADPRATIHESTYRDNRFLDAEAIRTLEGFKNTDDYYYRVYALGQWGVTGKTVFHMEHVQQRWEADVKPLRSGGWASKISYTPTGPVLIGGDWLADLGACRIYEEKQPGRRYVIGADTAGEGSDWFAAQVIDADSCAQVAVLHQQTDADLFAQQLYWLGKEYGWAMIAPEVNFDPTVVDKLVAWHYPNLYMRQMEDDATERIRVKYGFRTDKLNRPVAIAELIALMRDHPDRICDRPTLEEMMSFVRNGHGRAEAAEGAHDDLIMALAIAMYVRAQAPPAVAAKEIRKAKWEQDMFEDYYNASDEDRQKLIELWGDPF